jgi:hypothetical protein
MRKIVAEVEQLYKIIVRAYREMKQQQEQGGEVRSA